MSRRTLRNQDIVRVRRDEDKEGRWRWKGDVSHSEGIALIGKGAAAEHAVLEDD
jgi:hypothetical protein